MPGLALWITGDSRNLPALIGEAEPFDVVLSCPPYFDLEVFSDRQEDLSAAGSYAGFLDGYGRSKGTQARGSPRMPLPAG